MPNVVSKEHFEKAAYVRSLMANYREAQDLINIGAYQQGSNANIDKAVQAQTKINQLLRQNTEDFFSFDKSIELMNFI
jgi:flagellar biosynthesis/type III secretory pathway ATPase